MFNTLLAVGLVTVPGLYAFWVSQKLLQYMDDPLFAERVTANMTRIGSVAGISIGGTLLWMGPHRLLVIFLMLLGCIIGWFPARRKIFDESWSVCSGFGAHGSVLDREPRRALAHRRFTLGRSVVSASRGRARDLRRSGGARVERLQRPGRPTDHQCAPSGSSGSRGSVRCGGFQIQVWAAALVPCRRPGRPLREGDGRGVLRPVRRAFQRWVARCDDDR